jgi:antirestriction protein ArdC
VLSPWLLTIVCVQTISLGLVSGLKSARAESRQMIVCARHTNGKTGCLGNQLLALSQCMARGIQPGPIATFQRWKELGRYVRRGEKAITVS